jgi:hypothetical protein
MRIAIPVGMDLEKALALWPDTDLDAPFEPEAYYPRLINKFGGRVAQLIALKKAYFRNRTERNSDALLYYDMAPRGAPCNQYSFLSLLNILPAEEKLTLVDIGAGDGKVDIALAMMLPNITIHAVDKSTVSLGLLEKVIPESLRERVIPVHADYRRNMLPNADLAISVNPPDIFEMLCHNPCERALVCFDGMGYDKGTAYAHLWRALEYGLDVEILDNLFYAPELNIITAEFKRF